MIINDSVKQLQKVKTKSQNNKPLWIPTGKVKR